MNSKEIIKRAKQSFESVLANNNYNQIIKDDKHLNLLVEMMDIPKNSKVLDIGTGNGYIAFTLAELFPQAQIIGIDIAENAIERNRVRAKREKLSNLCFCAFDGENYPIKSASIDIAVTRYAFHHFPNIENTVKKISNLICDSGKILISDPIRNSLDNNRIIDKFMGIKGDGHVSFYLQKEIEEMFFNRGFRSSKAIITDMAFPFPRKNEYFDLYNMLTDKEKNMYNIFTRDGVVWIGKINVLNIVFEKVLQ